MKTKDYKFYLNYHKSKTSYLKLGLFAALAFNLSWQLPSYNNTETGSIELSGLADNRERTDITDPRSNLGKGKNVPRVQPRETKDQVEETPEQICKDKKPKNKKTKKTKCKEKPKETLPTIDELVETTEGKPCTAGCTTNNDNSTISAENKRNAESIADKARESVPTTKADLVADKKAIQDKENEIIEDCKDDKKEDRIICYAENFAEYIDTVENTDLKSSKKDKLTTAFFNRYIKRGYITLIDGSKNLERNEDYLEAANTVDEYLLEISTRLYSRTEKKIDKLHIKLERANDDAYDDQIIAEQKEADKEWEREMRRSGRNTSVMTTGLPDFSSTFDRGVIFDGTPQSWPNVGTQNGNGKMPFSMAVQNGLVQGRQGQIQGQGQGYRLPFSSVFGRNQMNRGQFGMQQQPGLQLGNRGFNGTPGFNPNSRTSLYRPMYNQQLNQLFRPSVFNRGQNIVRPQSRSGSYLNAGLGLNITPNSLFFGAGVNAGSRNF